jgi:hypothetical protein
LQTYPYVLCGAQATGPDIESHPLIPYDEMEVVVFALEVNPDSVGVGVPGHVGHCFLDDAETGRFDRRARPG